MHVIWIFCALLPFFSLHSQEAFNRSICLVIRNDFLGEREFAERIKIACKKLQWKVRICDLGSYRDADYDWVFTLVPGKRCSLRHDDYLMLFDPEHHYFNQEGQLSEYYLGYTGYLTTYDSPKRWYPTVQYRPYQRVTPTRLFCFIGHWGDRRDDRRYQTLQQALAQTRYANLFGYPPFGARYGKAFKGGIAYDGESVVNTISEMGVCLVLHSETHLKHEIPSGRIFEAVAASAVIISDLNPFVVKHFGDAVLYVDQTLSGSAMFNQIDVHMAWIQKHPEEALQMAERAHRIFMEHFLLEDQLRDFEACR